MNYLWISSRENYCTYTENNFQSKPHGLEDSWTNGMQTEEIPVPDAPYGLKQALVQFKKIH